MNVDYVGIFPIVTKPNRTELDSIANEIACVCVFSLFFDEDVQMNMNMSTNTNTNTKARSLLSSLHMLAKKLWASFSTIA